MAHRRRPASFRYTNGLMETFARARLKWLLDPAVAIAVRLKLSPNFVTVLGFLLNVAAGALIGFGYVVPGGLVMTFIAMPLDAVDGGLARATGRQTRFGAFSDSVLDRFAEGALLAGLAALFAQRGDLLMIIASFVALNGSFMVSYTRARAEGLGIECKVGIFSRFGRYLVLAVGLCLNFPEVTVAALAILTNITAIQRIVHVHAQLSKPA